MCSPGRNDGTLKVAIIQPFVKVAVTGTDTLSIVKLTSELGAFAKPEPTTVTVVPTAAVDGLTTVMTGAPVLVNVAEPRLVAMNVWIPAPDEGMFPVVVPPIGQALTVKPLLRTLPS